jgi:cytochrome d ubiquinol oxidase subunit II
VTAVAGFCLIAGMLFAYTLLDGYDLGAAAMAPLLAKARSERSAIVESIAPFWSGNEVWLVAAGGALFALFPRAYAVSFSGFYLPFVIVLWLLMFRGIAIELREHLPGDMWMDFWDVAFSASSGLLILLFGVAFGNLVRGFPLDAAGYFTGTFSSLLNPYALAVGALAVAALGQHGLAYVACSVQGPLGERALRYAGRAWWFVLALYLAVSAGTIGGHYAVYATPVLALAASAIALLSLVLVAVFARRRNAAAAFRASVAFLTGLLVAAAATMYPYLIRPLPGGTGGLTVFEGAPPATTVAFLLTLALAGLALVIAYSIFVRRRMFEKVTSPPLER